MWRLAAPLILSNLSVALLGLVDTAVVGHLPQAHHLGGVAIGGTIFNFLYWGFGFLRMGTSGLTAQQFGAGDGDRLRVVLVQGFVLALLLAAVVIALQRPIEIVALQLIDANAEVNAQAALYFRIRVWALPAVLTSYVLLGWLLGMQNGRAQLYLLVFVNAINITLDLLFVLIWDLGVAGVALGSVIAEFSGLMLGLFLARRELSRITGRWRRDLVFAKAGLQRFLTLNRNIFLRTLCLLFVFAFFNAQSARIGNAQLAANTVLMTFMLMMAYSLDGIAYAAEALVGRAIGENRADRFQAAVQVAGLWSVMFAIAFGLVYLLLGEPLVRVMTDIPEVIDNAKPYLYWAALLPVVSVWGFFLDGVFIGATRAREMRDTMFISVFVFYLPAWWLCRGWGNHGLWFAFTLFMAARGLSMAVVYRRIQTQGGFMIWPRAPEATL